MKCLDLTLPTPAENLACDEALLAWCEQGTHEPVLRFWEPREPFVVLGYGNRVHREVLAAHCGDSQLGIYRRCSGGGSVVQGPGCLNYALVLSADEGGPFRGITSANRFIMERHRDALAKLLNEKRHSHEGRAVPPAASRVRVTVEGYTDLAVNGLKCSGNSQRRGKRWLLFHGTFLLNLDLALVERALPMPSRQPAYRKGRTHREFLVNLGLSSHAVKQALCGAWEAHQALERWPQEETFRLARDQYATESWNLKF